MELYELGNLNLEDFKEEFNKLDEPEFETGSGSRFTKGSSGFNILHWAFYNFNLDVIHYLLDNHPYDLEAEMNKISGSISFKDKLPFTPVIEGNYGTNLADWGVTYEKYSGVFELLKEKNIIVEPLTKKQIESEFEKIPPIAFMTTLTERSFVSYLLDNNYIDSTYLSENMDILFRRNLKDSRVRIAEHEDNEFYDPINEILAHKNFKPYVENIEIFGKIVNINADNINVNRENYDSFIQGLKQSLSERDAFNESEMIKSIIIGKLAKVGVTDISSVKFVDELRTVLKDAGVKDVYNLPVDEDVMKAVANTLCVPLYVEFNKLYTGKNAGDLFIKVVKQEGYFNKEQIKSYEHEDGWIGLKRSEFFDSQVYLPRVNVLSVFKDVESPDMEEFRVSWLYHYLSSVEDLKICEMYQNKQGVKVFHNDISVESNAVISDLNLTIDKSIFETPVNYLAVNNYRPNIKIEDDTKESKYVLLTSLFNSKLTFDEITEAIRKIEGNVDFDVRALVKEYISNDKEEFSFLYEESSSFDKHSLLKDAGVAEPDNFRLVKVLHNMIMTDDKDFINYSLNKIESFNKDDFHQFLNTLSSYDHYIGIEADGGGDFNKEVLFIKNAQDEIFEIIASKKGQTLFFNGDVKEEMQKLYQSTFGRHLHNVKGEGVIQDIVKNSNFDESWNLLEKKIIVEHIANNVEASIDNKKKSRL